METKYGWPERVMVWVLTLVFLAAGFAKLAGAPEVVAIFERFDLPHWFMLLTAGVEITGALGLHFRRSVFGLAAPAVLAVTMTVGSAFHMVYDTPPQAAPAITLALLSLTVLLLRWPNRVGATA